MLLFIRQLSSFSVGASRFPCMVIITCKQELCKTVKKEVKISFVLAIVRAAAICTNTVSTIIHRQILQTARLEKHRQRVKIITSYSFKIREQSKIHLESVRLFGAVGGCVQFLRNNFSLTRFQQLHLLLATRNKLNVYISYLTLTFNCENTYYYHYYVHGLYLSECPQNLLQFLRFRSIRNLHSIFFIYKEFILHANGTATLKLAKF